MRLTGIANSIRDFLDDMIKGKLVGYTPAEHVVIRQAYHRFSSRSVRFPYRTCRLGPYSLRMNQVLQA